MQEASWTHHENGVILEYNDNNGQQIGSASPNAPVSSLVASGVERTGLHANMFASAPMLSESLDHSSTLGFGSRMEVLRKAPEEDLVINPIFLRHRDNLKDAQHTIQQLKAKIAHLESTADLKLRAYGRPSGSISSRPKRLRSNSTENDHEAMKRIELFADELPALPRPDNFATWERASCGKGRGNVSLFAALVNADGTPISGEERKSLNRASRDIVRNYFTTTKSFRHQSAMALGKALHQLESRFPFLRLCGDHFKATAVLQRRFENVRARAKKTAVNGDADQHGHSHEDNTTEEELEEEQSLQDGVESNPPQKPVQFEKSEVKCGQGPSTSKQSHLHLQRACHPRPEDTTPLKLQQQQQQAFSSDPHDIPMKLQQGCNPESDTTFSHCFATL